MTPAEVKLWLRLRNWQSEGIHFRRQAPVDGYILDFLCKGHKLIVEVDGGQYGEPEAIAYDARRDARFKRNGYRILRLWNSFVNEDPEGAADTVRAVLEGADPATVTFAAGQGPHPAR